MAVNMFFLKRGIKKIYSILYLINPLYSIRRFNTKRLENAIWGGLEKCGVDIICPNTVMDTSHNRYQITRPQHLVFIKEFLEVLLCREEASIIDIGCGKGGMLYFFSKFDFTKIAGLEYSAELCKICRDNMKKLHINAEIVNADAGVYDGYDEYNCFYLYNPFGKEVLSCFVNNLKRSYKRAKRSIYIIYTYPKWLKVFTDNGFKVKKEFNTSIMFKEPAVILILDQD